MVQLGNRTLINLPGQRSDLELESNQQIINEILRSYTKNVSEIVNQLRKLIKEACPQLKEVGKIGWRNITYEHNGIVCYIKAFTKYVNLGFYKGNSLSDPLGLLEGTGKNLRHIKIIRMEDINFDYVSSLVQEAFSLNDV